MRSTKALRRRDVEPSRSNKAEPKVDWDDLRYFLSIARHRTLAGAAKDLRVTQSTVGRRLASFEKTVGARLLHRNTDGYVLTLAGGSIIAHAMKVEVEALSLQRTIRRHRAHLSGSVRVMCSQLIATHLLAPCLAGLQARTTEVTIELLPMAEEGTSTVKNVDLIVQTRAFSQEDLVVRKLATIAFGLYGSLTYVAQCGIPRLDDGCAGHRLISCLDGGRPSLQAEWLSDVGQRGIVVLRSDNIEDQHRAAASGGGLAVLPCFIADLEPNLRRVVTGADIPDAEVWLGVHEAHRNAPRMRLVIDCLAEAVQGRAADLRRSSAKAIVLASNHPRLRNPETLMA